MTNEETLFVVVGVDKPTGNAVGTIGTNFTRIGMEYVHAINFDFDLTVIGGNDVDIRLTEDDKQVAFAGVLEVFGHVQVGVHTGLEHWNAA
ncbi:hypothetical protein D3C84_1065970 [compost metagenome]